MTKFLSSDISLLLLSFFVYGRIVHVHFVPRPIQPQLVDFDLIPVAFLSLIVFFLSFSSLVTS